MARVSRAFVGSIFGSAVLRFRGSSVPWFFGCAVHSMADPAAAEVEVDVEAAPEGGVPEALQQMADLLEAAEDPVPEDLGAQAGPLDLPEAAAAAVQHHNRVRNQLAEQVRDALGSAVNPQLILKQKEEIQKHAVSLRQAPEVFRMHYDTRECFSWALAGFNLMTSSFFDGGLKNPETIRASCASALPLVSMTL